MIDNLVPLVELSLRTQSVVITYKLSILSSNSTHCEIDKPSTTHSEVYFHLLTLLRLPCCYIGGLF